MEIRSKPEHDPVSDLYVVDAYMRWALLAAEEVVGKQGLAVVLRDAGLAHLIDNYPPDSLKVSGAFTFRDYTNLSAGLLSFFGRAGRSMLLRIGRLSSRHAREQQGAMFNVGAIVAGKLLPIPSQQKLCIDSLQNGFRQLSRESGQEYSLSYEDRGDRWAYVAGSCPYCAGKQADAHICISFVGVLLDVMQWMTGREFDVAETECRALGAPACVWEIGKKPKE